MKYRNILFLATGMTPQIITETLWALACDSKRTTFWIPDEIHVLSAEDGLNQIRARLFEEGVFTKMKKDYPILANVEFSSEHLHLITQDGTALKDLKTPADNELAANTICTKIQQFTQDEHTALHVSIAGGRKTMGFYAGYALSLYGRSQDRLSHVLVDSDFENSSDFYYPTPCDKFVIQRNTDKRLNAKEAQIWLAQIPFVRMRALINQNDIITQQNFSTVVALMNKNLQNLHMHLDVKKRQVIIDDKTCKLPPKEFSLYLLAVRLKMQGEELYYPSKEIEGDCIDLPHQQLFNQIYGKYKNKDDVVVDNSYMSTALSTMKKKFKQTFGIKIAEKISIQSQKLGYTIILDLSQIIIDN